MYTKIMRASETKEEGFTLIELLVVILIIGVLSSIAIPAFMNQRKEAADASLKADIKNIAMTYQTWRVKPGNNNALFTEKVARSSITLTSTGSGWTEAGLPEASVSPGNHVELVVITQPTTSTTWPKTHEENEFCLAGVAKGGTYAYPGGDAARYDEILYWDNALGGLSTLEEITEAMYAGKVSSCYAYVTRWTAAKGTPVPVVK